MSTRTANFPNLTPTLARHGAWTPWAQILCAACEYKHPRVHNQYPKRYGYLTSIDREALVEKNDAEYEELGWCDECHARCWTRYDVAICQQVGMAYSDISWEMDDVRAGFEMEQTGGMCCAATFPIRNDADVTVGIVVVTAMDGGFWVGSYKRTDEHPDEPVEWNDPIESFELEFAVVDDDYVDMDRNVLTVANVVIGFVRNLCKELGHV